MKKLRFKELSFLSYSRRKARKINLDYDLILIKGDSDTGKSCITKSLYSVLGASIKSVPETWKNDGVIVLLKFSIDGINYKVLNIGRDFYVFNPDGTKRSLSSTLDKQAKSIYELLNIHLPKFEIDGKRQTLYLDYLFMPFYIDQDDGWGMPWTSFSKCGSSILRSNFILLHTGVVSEDYFLNKMQYDNAIKNVEKIKADLAANKRLCNSMKNRFAKSYLSINEEDFTEEINSFVQTISDLKIAEKNNLSELKDLYNKKSYLTFSIEQLHRNIIEIDKDFRYALQCEDIITCPMCGSEVKNDFVGRLSMRDDIVKCKDLIIQNENELKEIRSKIERTENYKQEIRDKLLEMSQLMQIKKDENSFDDYLNSKFKIYFEGVMKEDNVTLLRKETEYQGIIASLKAQIDDSSRKERKKVIEEDFAAKVRKNLLQMNVRINDEKKITMSTNISMTGTKVPRAIVAYTYAFIDVMLRYGDSILCPIVVDEMRQRGLRDKDENTMFSYLIENKPKDSQLIIATASELSQRDENIHVIELTRANHLLVEEEFEDVSREIDNLLYNTFELRS